MNKFIKKYQFIILLLLFVSCQKSIDCISSTGEKTTVEFSISDFDTLVVNNDFEIHLIQDTVNKLTVTAYKKYADAVAVETSNHLLILDNSYKCKFTKPEKNDVLINLHVKRISRININSPSKLISDNILLNDDEIGVIVGTKFFEANLKVNCRVFYYWNIFLSGGKMYLHGNSEYLKLWNTGLFAVDASDLNVDNVFINTDSKGDIKIDVNKFLDCSIKGVGNVYYTGNPLKINVSDMLSSGKLIKVD